MEFVSTEEQREQAITLANEQEEWLYDDGWNEDAATYRKKRAELAEVGGRLEGKREGGEEELHFIESFQVREL